MKELLLFGSTGSIGKQTLEVIDQTRLAQVVCLSAYKNMELLEKQIKKYHPADAVILDRQSYERFTQSFIGETKISFGYEGIQGVIKKYAAHPKAVVLNAVVGVAGFLPSLYTLEAGISLALANKESLVVGGQILMPLAKAKGIEIIPVDSEHSAIYQCLMGNDRQSVKKIILTASGGPFRGFDEEALQRVSLMDALEHPTYVMGQKITIDSATLMNKAFEIIEAHFLFDLPMEQIEVLIHPESIVHSLVEYVDGSVIAQMGEPDMKLPIQLALSSPNRTANVFSPLSLAGKTLHFEEVNPAFSAISLAYEVMELGGLFLAVLNGANEKCVELFLDGSINYNDIMKLIQGAIEGFKEIKDSYDALDYQGILLVDLWAKAWVLSHVQPR